MLCYGGGGRVRAAENWCCCHGVLPSCHISVGGWARQWKRTVEGNDVIHLSGGVSVSTMQVEDRSNVYAAKPVCVVVCWWWSETGDILV